MKKQHKDKVPTSQIAIQTPIRINAITEASAILRGDTTITQEDVDRVASWKERLGYRLVSVAVSTVGYFKL